MNENNGRITRRMHSDVAIIGGGYSGIVLAIQLLRCCRGAMSIVIVDRSSRPGGGVAYDTRCHDHLLNVRARSMSALAGQPDHFIDWIEESGNASFAPDTFVPRSLYGESILFAAPWIAIPIVRSPISPEMRFRWRAARADSKSFLKTEP